MISTEKHMQTKEEMFIHAYETAFPKVAAFVKKMGGSLEEARDIFQDSLVIYYEKITASAEISNATHYIAGIARHLWYKKYRKDRPLRSLSQLPDPEAPEEELKVSGAILRFVELSGKKCLTLLQSFYYERLSMKEIAEKFGFSGERSATTQKYKCLEKVRDSLKERSLCKEDFYE